MHYFANMLKQLLTTFSQYTLNLPHMVLALLPQKAELATACLQHARLESVFRQGPEVHPQCANTR